jgi:hypothetical protein
MVQARVVSSAPLLPCSNATRSNLLTLADSTRLVAHIQKVQVTLKSICKRMETSSNCTIRCLPTSDERFRLAFGCLFKAVDLFVARFAKACTALSWLFATFFKNPVRIPASVKASLILCGLRSISRRNLARAAASGCHRPPPEKELASLDC